MCRSSMYQYTKGLSTGSRTSRARKSQFGGQGLSLSTAHSCKGAPHQIVSTKSECEQRPKLPTEQVKQEQTLRKLTRKVLKEDPTQAD